MLGIRYIPLLKNRSPSSILDFLCLGGLGGKLSKRICFLKDVEDENSISRLTPYFDHVIMVPSSFSSSETRRDRFEELSLEHANFTYLPRGLKIIGKYRVFGFSITNEKKNKEDNDNDDDDDPHSYFYETQVSRHYLNLHKKKKKKEVYFFGGRFPDREVILRDKCYISGKYIQGFRIEYISNDQSFTDLIEE